MQRFFLLFTVAVSVLPVFAQTGQIQPPAAASAPLQSLPRASSNAFVPVSPRGPAVLLLAIDDLTVSNASSPTIAPEKRNAPPDVAPAANAMVIAPASWSFNNASEVDWRVLSQLRPNKDKDAAGLPIAPDPPRPFGEPGTPLIGNTIPLTPQNAVQNPVESLVSSGRTGQMAVALRRALADRGVSDVQVASTDSAPITNAIADKRLSTRVLDDLKRALKELSRSSQPAPAVLSAAARATARIGQAVGSRSIVAIHVKALEDQTEVKAAFTIFAGDSQTETGEPFSFKETGTDDDSVQEAGALTASGLLTPVLTNLSKVSPEQLSLLAQKHFLTARDAWNAGRVPIAIDEINQAISLDSTRAEFFQLQGQILENTDFATSLVAYRRAVALNDKDSQVWALLAQKYAYAKAPNWPESLRAGNRAIGLGFDSAELRVAMATAQFGRSSLFRRANRLDRADEADAAAREHLNRALQISPDNPAAVRVLARNLIANRSFIEALQTLDRVAPRFPRDIELQTMYARALTAMPASEERQEDAFAAWTRVWQLTGKTEVSPDLQIFRVLCEGFDLRVNALGRSASQLTSGVASGTLSQETAFLQMLKIVEEMKSVQDAINIMQLPQGADTDEFSARQYAADLMMQALEAQKTFLETGQGLYRTRGVTLTQNAINQLNAARTTG